ncbi:MAG: hypothetical protein Q8876_00160 [Bacillota bacterium]|nr:hypothetical protein [Bacillota bacterium]
MELPSQFQKILYKYGSNISVSDQEKIVANGKAFIEPLRYKNLSSEFNDYMPLGYYSKNNYLYIGSPKIRLDQCTKEAVITCGEFKYCIKNADTFVVKDKIVYIWAILEKYISESTVISQ